MKFSLLSLSLALCIKAFAQVSASDSVAGIRNLKNGNGGHGNHTMQPTSTQNVTMQPTSTSGHGPAAGITGIPTPVPTMILTKVPTIMPTQVHTTAPTKTVAGSPSMTFPPTMLSHPPAMSGAPAAVSHTPSIGRASHAPAVSHAPALQSHVPVGYKPRRASSSAKGIAVLASFAAAVAVASVF